MTTEQLQSVVHRPILRMYVPVKHRRSHRKRLYKSSIRTVVYEKGEERKTQERQLTMDILISPPCIYRSKDKGRDGRTEEQWIIPDYSAILETTDLPHRTSLVSSYLSWAKPSSTSKMTGKWVVSLHRLSVTLVLR